MPRKVFAPSDVLAAADLNTFLMNQSVMTFASVAARTTAIPVPIEGMVVYLEDSNNIQIYNGSSWAALPVGSGGTGATTLASGGYLKGAGTSAITSQSGIPAGDITSGTLPIGRGGTGATTLASGGYLKGAGTSAITSQSGIPASDITSGVLPIARGGTGNALGAGTTLLANSTFTSQTSVALDNIFTADFVYYDVYFTGVGSAASGFGIRLRSGSTDLAGSGYFTQRAAIQNTTFVGESYASAAQFELGTLRTAGYGFWAGSIAQPFLANETQFIFNGFDRTQRQENSIGFNSSAASYNGIRIFNTVGNMTGNVRVYGRRA
jgi:hypothetical protein